MSSRRSFPLSPLLAGECWFGYNCYENIHWLASDGRGGGATLAFPYMQYWVRMHYWVFRDPAKICVLILYNLLAIFLVVTTGIYGCCQPQQVVKFSRRKGLRPFPNHHRSHHRSRTMPNPSSPDDMKSLGMGSVIMCILGA